MGTSSVSLGTTETVLVRMNPLRKILIITNEGTEDEIVRITDTEGESAAGAPLYNRDTYIARGFEAQKKHYGVSDTAATTISIDERY